MKNGVPQGSVLSTYISATSRKEHVGSRPYGYADDLAILLRHPSWKEMEEGFNKDMTILVEYLRNWRLQLTVGKTDSVAYHLNNREFKRELNVIVDNIYRRQHQLINQIINTGVFPNKLKIAKITPIFKKDDRTLYTNYRPISLLPIFSKVIEKVICIQINDFFVENKLFFNHQYGFRSGHSTELAALKLTDRIITVLYNHNTPLNIFLDLSKAFDTLDHTILSDKLLYYGIRGTAYNLLRSYLANREQFVELNDTASKTLHIVTGFPQGSILGPLLFLIYK